MPFTLRSVSAGIQMLRNSKLMTLVWNATLYIKKPYYLLFILYHEHKLGLLEKKSNFSQENNNTWHFPLEKRKSLRSSRGELRHCSGYHWSQDIQGKLQCHQVLQSYKKSAHGVKVLPTNHWDGSTPKKVVSVVPLSANGIFSTPEPSAPCPLQISGYEWHPELIITYNTL